MKIRTVRCLVRRRRLTELFRGLRRMTGAFVLLALFCFAGAWSPLWAIDSRYLFVWAGDADRQDSDFLAVLDIQEKAGQYGRVLATAPVGEKSLVPHHTETELGPSGFLFANGFAGNRSFVFDLRDPLKPLVVNRFNGIAGLSYPHDFWRLPNGHVVATFQGHDPGNQQPGGLAELDEHGQVIRSASVGDPTANPESLRPYGLAVVPALDRMVIAMTPMGLPEWSPDRNSYAHDRPGNQIQVWRLSDFTLVKTIRLPGSDGPNEARVLSDGKTVLVNGSTTCVLYRVVDLDKSNPSVERVHDAGATGCSVPIVVGNYWIQANAGARRVFSVDVSDLLHAHIVSSVKFDDRQRPHWLASDGSRVIVVNDQNGENRIWMLHIDTKTGDLSLDEAFRNEGAAVPGFSFNLSSWPHGATGGAVPHGSVFGK